MSQTHAPFKKSDRRKRPIGSIRVGQPISSTHARANFAQVLEMVSQSSTPIEITRKDGNIIMISSEDWHAIQETLYLNSIPGMAKSIIEGGKAPLSECSDKLD